MKKTEDWLSAMENNGYSFVEFNRWTRNFHFEKNDAKAKLYRIGYERAQGDTLPKSLHEEGWSKVEQTGNWYVLANDKPIEHVKTSPVREGIIKRNRLTMYIFSGILLYYCFVLVMFLSIMSATLFDSQPDHFEQSPLWGLTVIPIAVFTLSLYSVIKINSTNKSLIREKSVNLPVEKRSREQEKKMKRSGKMVVKRKLGWMYAPDKLEKWLEKMERQGFNLYRISRSGTLFYFIVGQPRNVRYCADFQNLSDERYFDIHKEAGWKDVFVSPFSIQKWTIWSQEYSLEEVPPRLYSDKSHHLKHARKIALSYTLLFLPLLILYSLNLGMFINKHITSTLDLLNSVMFAFCIIAFASYTIRTWLYYRRLKKQYDF